MVFFFPLIFFRILSLILCNLKIICHIIFGEGRAFILLIFFEFPGSVVWCLIFIWRKFSVITVLNISSVPFSLCYSYVYVIPFGNFLMILGYFILFKISFFLLFWFRGFY